MSIDLLSAFLIGLLGSGHCLGMCGGITTMLTTALAPNAQQQKTAFVILYHLGRISSYTFIGFVVALTGSFALKSVGFPLYLLKIIAGVFLILLGLYLGKWLMLLTRVEAVGKYLWQFIAPFSKKIIPVNTKRKSLYLGALWGWLPCGLVYSTLTWSLASGNALQGALIMLFFGLGTLPALIALSFSISQFNQLITNEIFRKFSAILLIIYGIYSLVIA